MAVVAGSRRSVLFVVGSVMTGLMVALGFTAGAAKAASPPVPSEEVEFVTRVNAVRTSAGLPPLIVDTELTDIAGNWAATIADRNQLAHNPDLANLVTADWTRLEENVGYGPSVEYVMELFENSSTHYPHMVDPAVSRIGVGSVHDRAGRIWTTHVFMGVRSAQSAPARVPETAPRPKPTAPATTRRPPPASTAAPAAATVSSPAPPPIELPSSYPAAYVNDVLPDVHEVALSGRVGEAAGDPHGNSDALAMIFFAVAAGAVTSALLMRLRE